MLLLLLVSYMLFCATIIYMQRTFLAEIRRLNHMLLARNPLEYAKIEQKIVEKASEEPAKRTPKPILEGM